MPSARKRPRGPEAPTHAYRTPCFPAQASIFPPTRSACPPPTSAHHAPTCAHMRSRSPLVPIFPARSQFFLLFPARSCFSFFLAAPFSGCNPQSPRSAHKRPHVPSLRCTQASPQAAPCGRLWASSWAGLWVLVSIFAGRTWASVRAWRFAGLVGSGRL